MSHYRITNTTVKPVRKGPNGEDLRTTVEKVGHAVTFRNDKDRPTIIMANRSTFVSQLDEGILRLQRGGLIKVEPIADFQEALKEHRLESEDNKKQVKQAHKEEKASQQAKVKATEMGMDKYGEDVNVDSEYKGAINPDHPEGKPNFVAVASKDKKGKKGKKGKRQQEESMSI